MLTTTAEPLSAALLDDIDGLSHGFFTRNGGVSEGVYRTLNAGQGSADAPEAVAANRRRVEETLGVSPGHLITMNQTHSADVLTVTAPLERPKVDALVSDVPGLALGVLTADCGPVLFADPQNRVIGGAHAGWRGALGGILEATIAAMEGLGASRAGMVAVLGPTIAQPSYEVGPELKERVIADDASAEDLFVPSGREGHALFDLPGYIVRRLSAAGVGRVFDLKQDTYADPGRFFSYRRGCHRGEPDYGRLVAAIALEH